MPNPPRRRSPPPRGIVLLVVMAAGFGLLAAILSTPLPSAPPAPSTTLGSPNSFPTAALVADGIVAVVCLFIAVEVVVRVREGRMPFPFRSVVVFIIALAIGVGFVLLSHILGLGGSSDGARGIVGNNSSSGPPPPPSSANLSANLTGPAGPFPQVPAFTYTDLGLLVLAVAVAVALYVGYFSSLRSADPPEEGGGAVAARIQAEIAESLRRLDEEPGAEPREVIIALYHRLLLQLRARHGPLSEFTPREIAEVIVSTYGVRGDHAQELTRLFEEARYSTHVVGPDQVGRARAALSGVLEDLRAWGEARQQRELEAMRRSDQPRPLG